MSGPFEQFVIKEIIPIKLWGLDLSITNSALAMIMATLFVVLFLEFSTRKMQLLPRKMQSSFEILYDFVMSTMCNILGRNHSFFGVIIAVFFMILSYNLIGLLPYSFTPTAQISINLSLSVFLLSLLTVIGLWKHKLHFFSLFKPSGVPLLIVPFIFCMEILAYCIRPFSLAIRLTANMVAGHIIIKVLAGMIFSAGVFGVLPWLVVVCFTVFEIAVSVLQTYIFCILLCVYLNDVLDLH